MAYPKIETEQNALLQIWKARVSAHKDRFKLEDDQVNQIIDDATMSEFLIEAGNLLEDDVKEFYAYKKSSIKSATFEESEEFPTVSLPVLPAPKNVYRKGIEARNQELYNYFKAHPNRTDESLADLGIGSQAKQPVSKDNLKPTLKGKASVDDRVELNFNKQGQTACRIQRRLEGGDWATIGEPSSSPWMDETTSVNDKPEKREYRAIYLEKNKPVGQYSDIITVYTTP